MSSSNLSAYLAKNYLTASTVNGADSAGADHDLSERPKKKRRKDKRAGTAAETSGLIIADDDDLLLSGAAPGAAGGGKRRGAAEEGADEGGLDGPQIYDGRVKSAEFRRKKESGWKSLGRAATGEEEGGGGGGEQEEADRIIEEAARAEEERRRGVESEDAPAVVEEGEGGAAGGGPGGLRMESGVKAGLQTAEDTRKLVEREEREKEREERRERKERKNREKEETVYRDATGRRIDVAMKRQEARQKEIEEDKARKREREEAMGDVQRRMKEDRQQELEDAKFLSLARGADDEEMNDRLKEVVRWDDPMAAYMAQKQADEGGPVGGEVANTGKRVVAGPQKKVYQGAAPPNRYGIQPGWRWDGVDRGNGFEKEWFQARSRTKRNEEMSYQWQMDE